MLDVRIIVGKGGNNRQRDLEKVEVIKSLNN